MHLLPFIPKLIRKNRYNDSKVIPIRRLGTLFTMPPNDDVNILLFESSEILPDAARLVKSQIATFRHFGGKNRSNHD